MAKWMRKFFQKDKAKVGFIKLQFIDKIDFEN